MHIIDYYFTEISRLSYNLLSNWGLKGAYLDNLQMILLLISTVLAVFVSHYLIRATFRFFAKRLGDFFGRSFFKHFRKNKASHFLAQIIPFYIVKHSIPFVFVSQPAWIESIGVLVDIYFVYLVIAIIMSMIRASFDLLQERPNFQDKPLKSYLQVIHIVFVLIGLVVVFSIATGNSPVKFFAAMGAASAVLLLMFKDVIMGFVASVQVTSNDMVRIGDWITMPKYGADGDVVEINLTTVKIQNFDKTITTIPTYALISDSFNNWRGMQASGGRRIKRALIIKQTSIRYIAEDELHIFKRIQGISHYIDQKQAEISRYNKEIGADRSIPVNGRNMTNSGLFRKYVEWYLQNHPGTNKTMTLMVRQLCPTAIGLPFEVYAFTNTVDWVEYEEIMSDIFDHLIAATPFFDLQLFESESGSDIRKVVLQDLTKN
ncbi:mechanosensitive channel protein [Bacteroidales bacterium]|nr:mechanosensitive channel protein [Bacteroidales bacterium]